uniref:Uncharacterized protein n=1 Tax=Caenorhabditis japonica TaxID=281687 RepID=A0A8R1ENK8_CAEJA
MKTQQDEYAPWYDTASINVFIHNRNEYVFSESVRYNMEPNAESTVNIFTGCLRTCYQDMIKQECGCMDPRYPKANNISSCQLSERNCVTDASDRAGDPSTWPSCLCPLPCSNQEYSVTWSKADFVSLKHRTRIEKQPYAQCPPKSSIWFLPWITCGKRQNDPTAPKRCWTVCQKPVKKPYISDRNRAARVAWARAHLNWTQSQWERVLWSDESKFMLFGSDGIYYLRRPVGTRYNRKYQTPTVKHDGRNVMTAWAQIPQSVLTNLPRRCQAIIDSRGFADKY